MKEDFSKEELERKEKALAILLEELKQEGKDNVSNRNKARASVEIDLQLNRFKDDLPKWAPTQSKALRGWSPDKNKSFIIETRRDALHARMNSESILTRLRRLEQIDSTLMRLEIAVLVILIVLVGLVVVQIIGWPNLVALLKTS
jgi:hypothetical protein